MMKRLFMLVMMVALSTPAFSQNSGGEPNNTNCNGVGNVNSPCTGNGGNGGGGGNGNGNGNGGGNGGGGGSGGTGGAGGNATSTATANANATANAGALATNHTSVGVTNTSTNTNTQQQSQVANGGTGGNASATGGSANATGGSLTLAEGAIQSTTNNAATIAIGNGGSLGPNPHSGESVGTQSTDGTALSFNGNATAPFSNANYAENNSQVGNVSATNGDVNSTNTNNNTATGGEGGSATATAVVDRGAVQIAEGALQSNYTYKEVQQAPAIGQGSFAINGCSVGGNAGGSWTGGAAFLGFGWTPEQCYDFMLAQAYQSLGEKKAACDILRNSKAGKRQEKRGVVLPGCEPEVKTVVVPVVAPDMSQYATKEELNRAFKKSFEK